MKVKPTARTPEEYLAQVPPRPKPIVAPLEHAIREAAPSLRPRLRGAMLGYGEYRYRNPGGREAEWFVVGLAARAIGVSCDLCVNDGADGCLVEKNAARLGRVSTGRRCIRLKRLEDLNVPVAMELVREAAQCALQPGRFAP